jgi:hypothetical protein
VGELLKELARTEPAENLKQGPMSPEATSGPSPYDAALQEHGISRQTAHKFQALANIPKPDFEVLAG